MKRTATKKKTTRRSRSHVEERPLEFERGWQELETRHDRIKFDWMSLAAQLNVSGKNH